MRVLQLFDRTLTRLVTVLMVFFFALMLGLAAMQVILRLLFHTGLIWGDIAARHLVIWVGFFGAYMATREDKHFHIDVLTRFLPPRWRLWLDVLSDLFAAVICYFLLQASLTFVEVGMDADAMLFLQVPQRAVAFIVPCGFGLIMVQFLLRTTENIVSALRGTAAEGTTP